MNDEDKKLCVCGHEKYKHNSFQGACIVDMNSDDCLWFEEEI